MITSFLEALRGLELPPGLRRLSRDEQGVLLDMDDVPCPAPQWPFERNVHRVRRVYSACAAGLVDFFGGLRAREALDEAEWERARALCRDALEPAAVGRYEERFRQLAVEVPEFALWAGMLDGQATRRQLADLRQLLLPGPAGEALPAQLETISRLHRAVLRRPIAETGDVPEGMRLPMLGQAYITPQFRVADVRELGGDPGAESEWAGREVRRDLPGFLAGYLTSGMATRVPLVVLGQPGAGKSVLTKMLSATLPQERFLPIRVPLREVAAEADLQRQIEQAVYGLSGERVEWPALARGAAGVLRVVFLDGFDELLQATGVRQTDYLEKVVQFQRREMDAGRAVAFVVTSRTAVAGRASFPEGTVVARLEPFDDEQIDHWLTVWNHNNAGYFRERGLSPLSPEVARAQGPLAGQPLLLLMLALYDADGNALLSAAQLRQVELYERLMRRFVERELVKSYLKDQVPALVEREMVQLACVAFSMFNRGRQWTTGEEFDADLRGLRLAGRPEKEPGFATPLTAGELAPGKFFFVHEARANRDGRALRTFEFLHATFGEFLIARLLASLLRDLRVQESAAVARDVDDGLMRALLSWATLSSRTPVLSFLGEMAEQDGAGWRDLVIRLFRRLETREDHAYPGYRPWIAGPQRRYAYYSANLMLMALAGGDVVHASVLMPGYEDVVTEWRRYALLWRSQCAAEEWRSIVDVVAACPEGADIALTLMGDVFEGLPLTELDNSDVLRMQDEAVFSYQLDMFALTHAMRPLAHTTSGLIGVRLHTLLRVLMLANEGLTAEIATYSAAINEWEGRGDAWLLERVMAGHLADCPDEDAEELMARIEESSESARTFITHVRAMLRRTAP
nr:hypothetical protein [Nonomuraea rhizosphaerae]